MAFVPVTDSREFSFGYSNTYYSALNGQTISENIDSSTYIYSGNKHIDNTLFSIVKLDRFIWRRRNSGKSAYDGYKINFGNSTFSDNFKSVFDEKNKGNYNWYVDFYADDLNATFYGDTSFHRDLCILKSNTDEFIRNFYSDTKIPIFGYITDKRFNNKEFTTKWAYKKNSNKKYAGIPVRLRKSDSNNYNNNIFDYTYYYKYGITPLVDFTSNDYVNGLKAFGIDTSFLNDYEPIPYEFCNSTFKSSKVIDFDGNQNRTPDVDQNVADNYIIHGYKWLSSTNGNTYYRKCSVLDSLPKLIHDAFIYLAAYAHPNLFKYFDDNRFFKWELYGAYSNVPNVYDLCDVRTLFDLKYLNKGTYIGQMSSPYEYGRRYDNVGFAPYMVTRLGKSLDNKIYMLYDIPLMPNVTRNYNPTTGQYTTYTKTISSLEMQYFIGVIKEFVGDGTSNVAINYNNRTYYTTDYSIRQWLNDPSTAISLNQLYAYLTPGDSHNDAGTWRVTCYEFLEYYRAAVATVWGNHPSHYNLNYGEKRCLSDEILSTEIYLAINAPGSSGGLGDIDNSLFEGYDDDIGVGGNAGSAAVFAINFSERAKNYLVGSNIGYDDIICNIYSTVLGGAAISLDDFDSGANDIAPNSATDVYVVVGNSAYRIAGGKSYPYVKSDNTTVWGENYEYNASIGGDDNDQREINQIKRIFDKRCCGYITTVSRDWFVYEESNITPRAIIHKLSDTSQTQLGAALVVNPYPYKISGKCKTTVHKMNLNFIDSSWISSDLDADDYDKNTHGVFDSVCTKTNNSRYYTTIYHPGTPPIITDIDKENNNLNARFRECSITYAANSIFANGGNCIRADACGKRDEREQYNGEYSREYWLRIYSDGRAGSGGGGLVDANDSEGFIRSGRGGSMAFQIFWYE